MTHRFTARLDGDPPHDDALADRLFEAGCDDGSLWSEGPATFVTFHREAPSLDQALATAARDVAKAGFRVKAVRMEAEDLAAMGLLPAAPQPADPPAEPVAAAA